MALAESPAPPTHSEPGWYPDPNRQHELRYFDGEGWTGSVTHYGPTPCVGCFELRPSSP